MLQLKTLAVALLLAAPIAAQAADTDANWTLHVGAHVVDPKSDTGQLAGMNASISKSTRPTFSVEYRFAPGWSAEVLAALPFKHDVRLNGTQAVSVKQLPPTIGVLYHFMEGQAISPFVGAGINYTLFFDKKGRNALDGTHVSMQNSWGAAGHAGVDIRLNDRWLFTVDARYMDIDTKVKVNGARVGTAHVDPWVYGLSFGYRL
ncbi:outer membrane beta-barrel protein [Luteibacter aegosomaticola]|uniref:OmpW/AlkL family protein n=1 Tax=Luteibacter aegosomaticola TaxID=2911538 RepID=UPI001FF70B57|nr:OmpW family outer membrane protein [Luteibacter aegosomaticola]UPG92100.1 outer membrane beta-barrel protein [Luteibacter aegosomaticola]